MNHDNPSPSLPRTNGANYSALVTEISHLLTQARKQSVRAVNAIMTTTYWQIGRHIVEYEQGGKARAEYGEQLLRQLSHDLVKQFGRGYGYAQLKTMRQFYAIYNSIHIGQSLIGQSVIGESAEAQIAPSYIPEFLLSWTHYVRLLRVADEKARAFYEKEALRGGWSVRQLDRQIQSLFYERCLLSKNKTTMLQKGEEEQAADRVTPEQEIKDPTVLEFLNLRDEYSESDLEEAIMRRLEDFLMEMGPAFTFVARQKKQRIGNQWYKIDLLLYHRTLRCLVILDLKLGKFDHADAGQMTVYLNYANEHWRLEGENPPVGLILCAEEDRALARYALAGKEDQILAREYQLKLPDEATLQAKLLEAQQEAELMALRREGSD